MQWYWLILINGWWYLASPCSSVHQFHSWETESASGTQWPPAWPAAESHCCALQTRSDQQTAGTKEATHEDENVFACSRVTFNVSVYSPWTCTSPQIPAGSSLQGSHTGTWCPSEHRLSQAWQCGPPPSSAVGSGHSLVLPGFPGNHWQTVKNEEILSETPNCYIWYFTTSYFDQLLCVWPSNNLFFLFLLKLSDRLPCRNCCLEQTSSWYKADFGQMQA